MTQRRTWTSEQFESDNLKSNDYSLDWVQRATIINSIEFFTISPQHKNDNITNFVLALPFKIKKTNKVCNLQINPFYQLTSNFTFTNILRYKWWRKLQTYGNTKLALMPLFPTLCVCEEVELKLNTILFWRPIDLRALLDCLPRVLANYSLLRTKNSIVLRVK